MAFPSFTSTGSDADASAMLQSACQKAGLNVNGIGQLAQVQLAVANLLVSDSNALPIPAADVTAGTFAAGAFVFPTALTVGTATGTVSTLALSTAAAHARQLLYQTATANRWVLQTDGTAESGANAGSDFQILARADNGNAIGTALGFARATMAATFGDSITTAAPTTGTAAAWKFGVKVTATSTLDTTQYIQLDVGGTLYKVCVST
jgi:hypothetical protein